MLLPFGRQPPPAERVRNTYVAPVCFALNFLVWSCLLCFALDVPLRVELAMGFSAGHYGVEWSSCYTLHSVVSAQLRPPQRQQHVTQARVSLEIPAKGTH